MRKKRRSANKSRNVAFQEGCLGDSLEGWEECLEDSLEEWEECLEGWEECLEEWVEHREEECLVGVMDSVLTV